MIVLLKNLNDTFSFPGPTLANQPSYQLRTQIIIAFADEHSKGIFRLFREPVAAAFVQNQALLC